MDVVLLTLEKEVVPGPDSCDHEPTPKLGAALKEKSSPQTDPPGPASASGNAEIATYAVAVSLSAHPSPSTTL